MEESGSFTIVTVEDRIKDGILIGCSKEEHVTI